MTFEDWLRSFGWLRQRDLPCIVSADLDGIACGLLQQQRLGWRVVGSYDGTALSLFEEPRTIPADSVVFIDVEVLRPQVRSIGNHLFALDGDDVARLRSEYPHCASPNLWRGITVQETFQRKYPFGTLPLLLASHAAQDPAFDLSRGWLGLALHTDSSFTNAAVYQANALDWLAAMGDGAGPGLGRFCQLLRRISAQQAISLLHEVQVWASDAGFGAKQRACRFDCALPRDRERVGRLLDRVRAETGTGPDLPFRREPTHRETYEVRKLPLQSKGRQASSFAEAKRLRVISMAATGRNDEGLSITVHHPDSILGAFR